MQLFVVGAGGFGREVYAYAIDAGLDVAGFVDDRADADPRVVASPDTIEPREHDRYVIAVGDPRARRTLVRRITARGGRFAKVVHPTAYVAATAHVSAGCVLAPFSFVGPGARLLEHVALNTYASAGHDAIVGPNAVFSPYAVVNGAVVVEEGVFLGTHATAVVGTRVGAWSKLAAGAVTTADVS
ncbi:MAG TPA: hypothetical protein VL463_31580, partial [Kofleriaceae bacterium]|nr:hypothetical protein [Kofleriaceae bacterium]